MGAPATRPGQGALVPERCSTCTLDGAHPALLWHERSIVLLLVPLGAALDRLACACLVPPPPPTEGCPTHPPRQGDKAEQQAATLPTKSLDGRLVIDLGQRGKAARDKGREKQQRVEDEVEEGGEGGEEEEEEEGKRVVLPRLQAAAGVAVAGVTIQDDLEEEQRRRAQEQQERQRAKAAAAAEAAVEEHARARKRHQGGEEGGGGGRRDGILAGLAGYLSREQRREAARQQIAVVARALLADPQGQLKQLRPLLALLRDEDGQVGEEECQGAVWWWWWDGRVGGWWRGVSG